MKNKTNFITSNHDNRFTIISNSLIEDRRLSLLSVGIMTYILKFANFNSEGRKWVVNKSEVEKRSGFGYNIFTKHWLLLEQCGYINRIKIKGGIFYEIIEKPTGSTVQHLQQITNVKYTNCTNATLESKNIESKDLLENLETIDSSAKELDNTNISFGKPNGKLLEPVPADLLSTENIFDNSIEKNSSLVINPGKIDFRPTDIDINCNESIFDIDIEMEGVSKPDVIHIEKKKLGPEALF